MILQIEIYKKQNMYPQMVSLVGNTTSEIGDILQTDTHIWDFITAFVFRTHKTPILL